MSPHKQRAAALLAQSTSTHPMASPLPEGLVTLWLRSPALHSHPDGPKQLLSLLGECRGTPSSWAYAALACSQRAMAHSPEMFLEGVTAPAPPNHCTTQLNRQPPCPRHWKARGAAGSSEQLWQLHRFPGNINNYPPIWNEPWAGQQKVSPRLCPIPACCSVQRQSIEVVAQCDHPHQDAGQRA